MMRAYCDRPAPLAVVTLRNPGNGTALLDVPMLIDSGADVTLIPQTSVNELGLNINSNEGYELMGFNGSITIAQVAHLDLIFMRRVFRGRFLISNQGIGHSGARSLSNHISLLLDGPHLSWKENEL